MKGVMNWVAHLEHLQIVLIEFEAVATLGEDLFIWYFWDRLKLSICVWLDK